MHVVDAPVGVVLAAAFAFWKRASAAITSSRLLAFSAGLPFAAAFGVRESAGIE